MNPFATLLPLAFTLAAASAGANGPANPLIDYSRFEHIVLASASARDAHRINERTFIESLPPQHDTVILDARSASMYRLRHVKGAVNLPFTDFTADSLARVIPRKNTKVIIYCNNNFTGSPASFATKTPAASLNLSTYTSLIAYGYTNVFELAPLLDVRTTAIPFEGTEVSQR